MIANLVKNRRFLAVALVAAVVVGSMSVSSVWSDDESPLAKHMEKMNSNLKKLQREARRGPIDAAGLKMIVEIQEAALFCKGEVPPISKKWKEAEKEKMMIGYKKGLSETLKHALDLEIAVLEKNQAKTKEIIDALFDNKKKGHEVYTEE